MEPVFIAAITFFVLTTLVMFVFAWGLAYLYGVVVQHTMGIHGTKEALGLTIRAVSDAFQERHSPTTTSPTIVLDNPPPYMGERRGEAAV